MSGAAVHTVLTIVSIGYLLWLAWAIASAPLSGRVGNDAPSSAFTLLGGFILGFANPKAYLAFASLFGSFALLMPAYGFADGLLKWTICVIIMAVVDLSWLLAGVALGRISLTLRTERIIHVAMGVAILLACIAALM